MGGCWSKMDSDDNRNVISDRKDEYSDVFKDEGKTNKMIRVTWSPVGDTSRKTSRRSSPCDSRPTHSRRLQCSSNWLTSVQNFLSSQVNLLDPQGDNPAQVPPLKPVGDHPSHITACRKASARVLSSALINTSWIAGDHRRPYKALSCRARFSSRQGRARLSLCQAHHQVHQ
jgi:hypothetical protein